MSGPQLLLRLELEPPKKRMRFSGSDYVASLDEARLTGQILRIFECMKDGKWRTVPEIGLITNDPHTSISAQLRNLRKPEFGGYEVPKRRRGAETNGLFEYRVALEATCKSNS